MQRLMHLLNHHALAISFSDYVSFAGAGENGQGGEWYNWIGWEGGNKWKWGRQEEEEDEDQLTFNFWLFKAFFVDIKKMDVWSIRSVQCYLLSPLLMHPHMLRLDKECSTRLHVIKIGKN